MKRFVFALALLVAWSAPTAQEIGTLETPILQQTGVTQVRVRFVQFDVQIWQAVFTVAEWSGGTWVQNGRELTVVYNDQGHFSPRAKGPTPTGQTIITAINKSNLATQSLENRILQRLVTDGHIPKVTISGAPQ